jgi:hypothetical protein
VYNLDCPAFHEVLHPFLGGSEIQIRALNDLGKGMTRMGMQKQKIQYFSLRSVSYDVLKHKIALKPVLF